MAVIENSHSDLQFEWHDEKNAKNLQNHQIDFFDASYVFNDPKLMIYPDLTTDTDEERYLAVGSVNGITVLLVVHTYRGENSEVIRIISARKLSKGEVKKYGYY